MRIVFECDGSDCLAFDDLGLIAGDWESLYKAAKEIAEAHETDIHNVNIRFVNS